ncbi:uncharacterized protein [Asterias amurensis]|uniref:uncharacterized protein isoform X2 n=1 Tax=Asterias amurensis TaxID=7602 RepID=UPI003AB531F7
MADELDPVEEAVEGTLTVLKGLKGIVPKSPGQPSKPVVTQPSSVRHQIPRDRQLEYHLHSTTFSPASWSVLKNLEAQYGQKSQAVRLVDSGLKNVIQTARNGEGIQSYEERYKQLSEGVLFSGERFTGTHCFDFSKVEFQHVLDSQQVTAQLKPAMTAGRIYLTNQRLILLSIGDVTGLQLTDAGSRPVGNRKCVTLSITDCETSTWRYESIQLADIRGVGMSSVFSGAASSRNVKGLIPPPPRCSCSCCDDEAEWELSPHISSTTPANLVGVINLGTLLPPWQTESNVAIFVPPNSKMDAVVEIIRALQCAAHARQPSPEN